MCDAFGQRLAVVTGQELLPQLRLIQKDTVAYLHQLAAEKGDAVHFKLGAVNAYFLNHPDLIKHILQDNNKNYSKDTIQYNSLSTVTGKGLLTSDGPLWLRQRRLEQPAFSRARMNALDSVVVPATRRMLDAWGHSADPRGELDVDSEMMRLTLEVVGRALFSIDLSNEARHLTEATLTALDHIVHRARNPFSLPDVFPTPANIRFRRAVKSLDAIIAQMVSPRRTGGQLGEDMLGMLLAARDDEGQPMTAGQIRDEIITLLIAGHETVASALTWTWYLLAQAPHVREQVRREAASVLDGREPTTGDLERMPLGGQVFDEALRLFPPAWLITRKAIEADQVGGLSILPGSLIILSPYVIHRHPHFWKDPLAFDPDRFTPGQVQERPRYAYIPFGGGPRLCIGNNFAAIEARLIIAMVLERYCLDMTPGQTVTVDALVTLRPRGGLPMRLVPVQPDQAPASSGRPR